VPRAQIQRIQLTNQSAQSPQGAVKVRAGSEVSGRKIWKLNKKFLSL
jgi:hypothetical protein